jgi:hypothetical protein
MSTIWRWSRLLPIAAVSVLALTSGPWIIAGACAAGMLAHVSLRTDMRWMLGASVPTIMFGAVLVGLQRLGGNVDLRVPLRVIAVFLLSTAAARLIPVPDLQLVRRGSRWRVPVLFLFFVRHFATILIGEVRRTFQARALCVSSNLNRSGLQSLAWATVAVFRRCFDRAERFYAAQMLSGFEE